MGNKGSFVTYRKDLQDPRNGGPEGDAWATVIGGQQDAEMVLLRSAMLCRLPTLCPADALDHVGPGAFGLERMPAQTDDAYRAALVAAAQTYTKAGSAQAVIDEVAAYAGGSLDIAILRDCDGQTSYANGWYSRFDVQLGPNFGTLAVQQAKFGALLATTTEGFTMPGVGQTVLVTVDSSSLLTFDLVVYVGQAGYLQVQSSGSGSVVLTNLGGAPAACAALGLTTGTLGTFTNLAEPADTVATGQPIVAAGAAVWSQTQWGTAFVDDEQQRAVKNMILRWKAAHGYAGRIQLFWTKAILYPDDEANAGYFWSYTYVGRMFGLDAWFGLTPWGGYDRS